MWSVPYHFRTLFTCYFYVLKIWISITANFQWNGNEIEKKTNLLACVNDLFRDLKNCRQILREILSEFKRINKFGPSWNHQKITWLTLSWRRPISYRNQSIDLLRKSVDWFLYDIGLRHERVNIRNEIWRWSLTKAGNTREYWLKLNLHLKKWGKICFTQPSLVKLIIEYFFNIEITMCKNYHVLCHSDKTHVIVRLTHFRPMFHFYTP